MKNKQMLSLLLAGCMTAAPVVPVYATTSGAESAEALIQESEEDPDIQEAPIQESAADEQDNTPVYKETGEAFFPEFLEKETLEDSVASLSSDPVQNFVSRLYSNILGRNADPNGLATWTEVLNSYDRRKHVFRKPPVSQPSDSQDYFFRYLRILRE